MLRRDAKVYFDPDLNALVYVGMPADERYWDGHWKVVADDVRRPDQFVVNETKRWLSPGARVIDAGCGLARTVYGLHNEGFEAYGVDYAPETVRAVSSVAPELRVSVADVRDLSRFPDGFFDGYWSLGVIEHFFEGYGSIVEEMRRVVKPGGLVFVTVPTMSPLRQLKAWFGAYPAFNGDSSSFYQFALPADKVVADFLATGFRLEKVRPRGGFKGLKDEVGPLGPILQRMYDSKLWVVRGLRKALDVFLGPVTCHTRLYVFRA
ncbi:class I SAM-dependent methyltransferase [Caulobacter sp. 17J65-9]|uniref:class I SAM-dependent methyltransferase n=1 Tax=Caulobacter sp. 17J65-9 TaxID=2709382 RepID=UPI0013CCC3F5|nr:class I SAM-dependent methyltransferase [Caulobacter sp. 17J65-9]NEX92350.1 class I SAM-dependent methyltransferase [Caulobacter sp. 17J65-9]